MGKTGFKKVLLGCRRGIDSAIVATIPVMRFGLTMFALGCDAAVRIHVPSSLDDAESVAKALAAAMTMCYCAGARGDHRHTAPAVVMAPNPDLTRKTLPVAPARLC